MNIIFTPSRLLKRRKELGLSQQAVADLAGITGTTYCLLENGRNVPLVTTFARVAHALSKPPAYFFTEQTPVKAA